MLPMTMMVPLTTRLLLLLTLQPTVLPPALLCSGDADKAMQTPSSGCRRGLVETRWISAYKIGDNGLIRVLVRPHCH